MSFLVTLQSPSSLLVDLRYQTKEKIARVNWICRQYSDVYRSTIIDPSPLKEGQKVKVIWGKTKKEHTAVVACYPLEEVQEIAIADQSDLPPRRAKAKRKLVSSFRPSNLFDTPELRIYRSPW